MGDGDWDSDGGGAMTVFLNGHAISEPGPRGERIADDSFLLCFNAHHEPIEFTVPPEEFGAAWLPVVDTASDRGIPDDDNVVKFDATVEVSGRSVVLLKADSPS